MFNERAGLNVAVNDIVVKRTGVTKSVIHDLLITTDKRRSAVVMDGIADQNSELAKILAMDMQDLDSTRSEYETQAKVFSRQHDIVVTVVLACSIVLILSGFWWVSVFVFLIGIVVISILKARKLAAERQISQIDSEIRQISLEILGSHARGQD